ncbi:hypothetical protein N9D47_02500 [Planktomarina temperata]|nr:hypothetical protein [Planktomarina temperata]
MFVYRNWDRFCLELSKKYNCIRVDEIINQPLNRPWIAIKHDVETNVKKALEIAKIEKKYNIKATYFVQSYLLSDNIELLKSISDMGHEVSYHYDVLDSNGGNMAAAIKEFSDTVSRFRKHGFEVNTVCPHGNPLMQRDGWSSNKDFFRNKDVVKLFPGIFDIVVQTESFVTSEFAYISDAGYGWKLIGNIDSNDIVNNGDIEIGDIGNMLELVGLHNKVIISSHPHRWSQSYTSALAHLMIFKIIRFIAKSLAKIVFVKTIMSRFYYLAKKF